MPTPARPLVLMPLRSFAVLDQPGQNPSDAFPLTKLWTDYVGGMTELRQEMIGKAYDDPTSEILTQRFYEDCWDPPVIQSRRVSYIAATDNKRMRTFIALDPEIMRVVGEGTFSPVARRDGVAMVTDILRPTMRNRGYGKSLITGLCREGLRAGYHTFTGDVRANNEASMHHLKALCEEGIGTRSGPEVETRGRYRGQKYYHYEFNLNAFAQRQAAAAIQPPPRTRSPA